MAINTPIISYSELRSVIKPFQEKGKTITLVTGVFDLLHPAHRTFLQKAKRTGDVLVVGVETDERVRQIKGKNRPIEPLSVRMAHIAAVKEVDIVFALPEDLGYKHRQKELIEIIKPQILAVSSHTKHLEAKKQLVALFGGKVHIVMEQDARYSTTKLLKSGQKKSLLLES